MIKTNSQAQTGLNFQGVARSSNNVIIASQQISLRLSILQGSATGNVEYSETRKVTTNAQGLFAVVIGDTDATNTIGNFTTINWKNTPKFLKIEMDANAGNNYTTIGTTQFQYVAYAQFASSVDAENIVGVVPVARGGTGATNLAALKTALALDKINNTSDVDKPVSAKTQTALDLKLNAADTSRYVKQNFVDAALMTKFNIADTLQYTKKSYTDSSQLTKLKLSDTARMLSNRIGKDTLNLSARINTKANSSDVTNNLANKLNIADTSYLLQKVDTITLSNRIDLKANSSDVNTSIAFKENASNKSIDIILDSASDIKFPSVKAVKSFVDAKNTALSTGLVSLTTSQSIDGQKTFQNNLVMGNVLGTGTSSPTTINFANGSSIGDIQNIKEGNPDIGSIDLYAPDGAKWVQLNYGNTNYFSLDGDGAYIDVSGIEWNFLNNGVTELPGDLNFKNNDVSNINANNELNVSSKDIVRVRHDNGSSYTRLGLYEDEARILIEHETLSNEWNFKVDGSSWFPGDLYVTDNHSIHFVSVDNSTSIPNASITSNGPFLKIQTRALTPDDDTDAENGISLEYENLSNIKINSSGVQLNKWNINNGTPTFVDVRESSFNFFSNDNSNNQNRWYFNGEDASTHLPGKIKVAQKTFDDFGLSITSPSPIKDPSLVSDKLGSTIGLISNIGSSTSSNTAFIQLNPQGEMIFKTLQQKMSFENDGVGDIQFKFKIPAAEDPANPGSTIPEFIKTIMYVNNDNVFIDGSLTIGSINYPKSRGSAGQVLTIDNTEMNAIWVTPTNTLSNTTGINAINGITSGTHSLTVGTFGTNFTINNTSEGDHIFNIPYSSTSGVQAGLLSNNDWQTFNNKQEPLINAITGNATGTFTRTNGLISFYDGENSITGDSRLFWDGNNKRLGIGTQTPGYPIEINTGDANYGLMISSESANTWGSGIGFKSSTDAITKTGLFQLDRDGAMVFRTLQDNMYFDNAGSGSIKFRMGDPNASDIGMFLNNSGNLEVTGTLKTGAVTFPKVVGNDGDVLTFDSHTNKAVWQAPTNTNISANVEASTLSGTTLNATITGSSLTSVGTIASLTTGAITNSGKLIVGASSAASSSAVLEASSTTQGFLPPRMSDYQKTLITAPVAGLTVWCSNCGASGEMQVFNGGIWTNMIGGPASSPISLSIGDSYQGGKVVYILQSGDPGYDPTTQHGIIAANSDQSAGIWWSNNTASGATGTEIGSGFANTMKIISTLAGGTITDYAAGIARTYKGGGYSDWYLPSIDELEKLYQYRASISGFSDGFYWSSTESVNGNAYNIDFFNGQKNNSIVNLGNCHVRAIRSF